MKFRILLAFVLFAAAVSAQIPLNGLIGNYMLNGDGDDMTSNNNNGTVQNTTNVANRYGIPNTALYFNGTDSKVIVGDVAVFENTNTISFSVWIKAESLGSGQMTDVRPILAKWKSSTELSVSSWHFYLTDSVHIEVTDGTGFSDMAFPITFANGEWTMLTGIFSSGNFKLYVNGALLGQKTAATTTIQNSSATFLIGDWYDIFDANYNTFKGAIDDVRIYNRVITDNEVKQLYNEFMFYDTTKVNDTVHVVVYDTTHITVTDTLVIDAVITGTGNPPFINTIKVYPNPSNDFITIDNGDFTGMNGYRVKITSSTGTEVFNSLINQQQFSINLSTWLGKGVYTISLYDAGNSLVDARKIVLK
ncbi:MAG TPA: LamG-like jellyroll fold domain-containing protein [Bacteroidia bacterium]|nr:LamG-like jellyroll fold domain-containing protein [Bacteroidia bacterium]